MKKKIIKIIKFMGYGYEDNIRLTLEVQNKLDKAAEDILAEIEKVSKEYINKLEICISNERIKPHIGQVAIIEFKAEIHAIKELLLRLGIKEKK